MLLPTLCMSAKFDPVFEGVRENKKYKNQSCEKFISFKYDQNQRICIYISKVMIKIPRGGLMAAS